MGSSGLCEPRSEVPVMLRKMMIPRMTTVIKKKIRNQRQPL
jgi:hypothetical protein